MQETPTKLSLDRWARILGISPLHFWGVNIPEQNQVCSQGWFQYSWQDAERSGREDVARAIAEAEADIERLVGYHLAPDWDVDEWLPTARPYRRDQFILNNADIRGLGQVVAPRWGHFISGGIRSFDVLSLASNVVYASTRPPTTYLDQATVTLALAQEYPDCEIAVYYPNHAGEEAFRIRPIEVTHDALLNYTITFRREQAVIESALWDYDLANLRVVNGTDNTLFLTTVAVGRIYNDPQQQVALLWEPFAAGCSECNGAGCGVCGYSSQTGCLLVRGDPRLSQVVAHPADWNAETLTFDTRGLITGRSPDLMRMWYYSGWRAKNSPCPQEMDEDWARVVAYLAASKLERCPCQCFSSRFDYWTVDLAFSGGANELARYNITIEDLGNPIGTRRGAINAWRVIKQRGVAIGHGAIDLART